MGTLAARLTDLTKINNTRVLQRQTFSGDECIIIEILYHQNVGSKGEFK